MWSIVDCPSSKYQVGVTVPLPAGTEDGAQRALTAITEGFTRLIERAESRGERVSPSSLTVETFAERQSPAYLLSVTTTNS